MGIHLNILTVKKALKKAKNREDKLSINEVMVDENDMLAIFNRELLLQHKGYKTCARDHNTRWVYREGDNFCLGYFGYGDFLDGGDGTHRFSVFAPSIQNKKYKRGHRQNMLLSDSLVRAMKNIHHFRPLSVRQCIALTGSDCSYARMNWSDNARKEVSYERGELVDNFFDYTTNGVPQTNELQEEIRHLVDTGHEFLNPKLGEKLKSLFVNIKELAEVTTVEEKPMTFVEVVTTFDKPRFRVARDVDIGRVNRTFEAFPYTYDDVYTQEEMPQEMMGKIANLNMVEDGQYIAGVGYRFSEKIFYLRSS